MQRSVRSLAMVLVVLAMVAAGSAAHAQGVTGAAVTGTITGEGAGPLEAAEVQIRNSSTGEVFSATSTSGGRYFIDNVPPGGPFTLTVRFEGYPLTTKTDIQLNLGQKLSLDVVMKFQVEEIVIVEQIDPLQDRGRTGASTTVKEGAISKLPLQGRNFTDLVSTAPQVSGNSIGGQNNRFNNIQIDGGANNDLFGLSGNGTPGGQSNAKPLSIEAIKEFVVQIAPFDVRQGSFVGGLVNAITKSGTNEFHGSVFGYYQNKAIVGKRKSCSGTPAPGDFCLVNVDLDQTLLDFHTLQFGGSVGGPIIQDKLHFFLALDLQDRSQSFSNQFQIGGTDSAADIAKAGFDLATAQRFATILATKYGIKNVGDALAPSLGNPDRNVFGKITWAVTDAHRLELSYNFVNANLDVLARFPTGISPSNASGGYQLSNSGYSQVNNTNTARFKLTSRFGGGNLTNEALGGVSIIRDHRDMPQILPLILVKVGKLGSSDAWLAAGGERFSHGNVLDQDIFQLQDNVSFGLGDHRVTVGTSDELLKIRNVFFQAAYGVWTFDSLDLLDAGTASNFQRRIKGSSLQEPGTATFNAFQVGLYAQDEWQVIKNLTVTPGIRIDVPFLSGANANPALVGNAAFPLDTSKVPTGNLLWSPRVGFNWDVEGTTDTIVRGGAGIFTGRPPYVWVSNAYAGNGLASIPVTCSGANVPTFSADPNNQPDTCTGSKVPAPEIDYFDPNTKYPQNFQTALGLDKRLPWGLLGTVDLLYTHDVNGWYTADENLKNVGTSGEGRTLYGSFAASTPTTFSVSPTRVDPTNVGAAIKVWNKSEGQVYSGTLQLGKRFGKLFDVNLGYTYSRSQDLMSFTSSQAFSNFQFAPIDGTLEQRNLRPSAFDRPHKITVTGTADLPYGFQVGLSYVGQSGTPYTWTVSGDVNGDGISANDLVFVPGKAADISLKDATQWNALDTFINGQDCLRGARGRLIQRGECRNPWQNFLNMRLGWGMKTYRDQRFEVQLDIFNVLNLLSAGAWGNFEQATGNEAFGSAFLKAAGYDTTANRPIYTFAAPTPTVDSQDGVTARIFSPTQSRWRIQLGARYAF